ncbi:ABC transporter permease [Luteococcus sp. H138]|uniref:ABC transporter permease n=1 Tax=unclassified Luteococcus TaxID=2639923 RepID=UPI00313E60C8
MSSADDPTHPGLLSRLRTAGRQDHGILAVLRGRIPTVVGMILLPLMIASSLLWGTGGNAGRVQRAEAAIVNLDEGTTVGDTRISLGQDYARHLRNQRGANFAWRYGVSVEEAEHGLASGQYSAAVIIPSGFSRVLTGTSAKGSTERATLVVEKSPVAGVSDQVVFGQLSTAATQSLSNSVTKKYLDKLFVTSTEVGSVLGQTSTAAREAALAAGQLDQQAKSAREASQGLGSRAATASDTADEAANSAQKAAKGAAGIATPTPEGAATVPSDASSAAAEAAKKAGDLARATTTTRESADQAVRQAAAAGADGAAMQGTTQAIADAAAANQAAAGAYTGKVGQAVRQQAELQAQLAQVQGALTSYVSNVQVVTDAVQQASGTINAVSGGTSRITYDAGQDSAGGSGANRPRFALLGPVRAQNLPQSPTDDAVAARDELVRALRAAASELGTSTAELATLRADAEKSVTAAEAVQDSYAALVKDLPTQEVKVNPGRGNGPAACRALATKSEIEACKIGYNAAVGQVNTALALSGLGARAEAMVAQSKATRDGLRKLQTTGEQTSLTLTLLAGRLAELTVVITVNPGNPTPDPTQTPTPQPTQTVTVTASPEPGQSVTPQPTETVTVTASPTPSTQPTEPTPTSQPTADPSESPTDTTPEPTDTGQPSPTPGATDALAPGTPTGQPSASQTPVSSETPVGAENPGTPGPSQAPEPSPTSMPAPSPGGPSPTPGLPTSERPRLGPSLPTVVPTQPSVAPSQPSTGVESLHTQRVTAAVSQLNATSATVQRELDTLATSLASGQSGLETVAAGSDAERALTDGASSMTRATTAQASVVQQLTASLSSLNEQMAGLGTSIRGLDSGAQSLSEQNAKASDNATRLAGRVDSLNQTITGLQQSTRQVASDAATAVTRTAELQRQISGLQQSSGIVDTRTGAVAESARSHAKQSTTVASRIGDVQTQVPSYDDAERQKLTDVVSQPIDTSHSSAFRNIGWISMLMLLSLWIGAMGLHSTFNGISEQARRSSASSRRLLVGELGPAAVVAVLQALAVSMVGQAVLQMSPMRWLMVTGTLVLASLAFAAINHALVAFLRAFGRLIAAACAVVTGVTVLTQAHPTGMGLALGLSPVTPAVNAVRGVMTGVSFPASYLALLAWLVVGVLFSSLAILRARVPEPIRVPTIHDEN